MMATLEVVGNIVVVVGALVFATAALGLIRFPDVYTRASAVGTAGGVGIILVIMGCVLVAPSWRNLVIAVLAIGLHLATSSVGTMAVARSAYLSGVPLLRKSFDELADETERRNAAADAAGDHRFAPDAVGDDRSGRQPAPGHLDDGEHHRSD